MQGFNPVSLFALLIIIVWLFNSLKVLREYERGVVFRLGRLLPRAKGPGLIFVFWPIDKIVKVPLRTVTLDVPPQDIITRDNVSVRIPRLFFLFR
jgi:regulator of protease activity HflC (stomatin/prohibitin superfamily)